jgi:hypothetical protein
MNMRLYRYACHFIDMLYSLGATVALFELAVVCTGFTTSLHSLQTLKVEAFKVIAVLPRIYRESYATHGHSLEPDRIRT